MKKDFQTWWNEHHFHTNHPCYEIDNSLYRLGADLDYVEFLSAAFNMETPFFKQLVSG